MASGKDEGFVFATNLNSTIIKDGSGNSEIYGGKGVDTVYDGGGDDTISTDTGNDTIYGGAGVNTIDGGGRYRHNHLQKYHGRYRLHL